MNRQQPQKRIRSLHTRVIGLSAMLMVFALSCTSTLSTLKSSSQTKRQYIIKRHSPRGSLPPTPELAYFLEIALGSEYGMADFTIKKWVSNIDIEVIGYPTAADLQTLDKVIKALNQLVGRQIRLKRVESNGNLQIYFVPEADFYLYEPTGLVFYGGFFWSWWNYADEIYKGRIVIACDKLTPRLRSHLIIEELTQSLGLMNDATEYQDSIFYQEYSEVTEFSNLDKWVISLLYSDIIYPGMRDSDIKKLLAKSAVRF